MNVVHKIESFLKNKNITLISFDVFDTIIERIIPSDDVIKISAIRLSELIEQELTINVSWQSIYNHRIDYGKTSEKNNKRDWTIIEWLNNLKIILCIEKDITDIGIQAEIFAESHCTRSKQELVSYVKTFKKKGYVLAALSDTWLDTNTLSIFLKESGFVFDYVFSSGSIKKNKKTGSIFKYVEQKLCIKPRSCFHIGDNFESDYIRPKLYGWNSIWLPSKHPLTGFWMPKFFHKGIFEIKKPNIIKNLLCSQCSSHDPLYKMAYEKLAPLIILFTIIQHKHFKEQGIQAVFYLARDTHLLYKSYNLMAPYLKTDWQNFYIRLSRRTVSACHPDNPLINIKPIAGKTSRKNVNNWLGSFSIDDDLKLKIMKKSRLKGHEPLSTGTREKLKTACDYYKQELDSFILESKELLKDFLGQHFNDGVLPERIGIIDSGWACTIQDCMANVLKDKKISGMYLGVGNQGRTPNYQSDKYGLIRDDFRNPVYSHPLQSSAGVIRVWETILRENAGTVSSLKRSEKNQVVPIIKKDSSIGIEEQKACIAISDGVMDGINGRKKQIALLPYCIDIWNFAELESVANYFADAIAIYPDKVVARKVIALGFDEGIGTTRLKHLGLNLENRGLIWVPGIISLLGIPAYILTIISPIIYSLLKIKRKI